MDRFHWLSQTLEGDVLQPVWFRDPKEVEAEFGPGSYPVYTRGRFRYHWFLAWRFTGLRRRIEVTLFYLRVGLRLLREQRFECIIAYSHMNTGVLAGILKLLSGTKSVIEVVTSPDLVFLTDTPSPGMRERILHLYSDICLHVSAGLAECVRLLYPEALGAYPLLKRKRRAVFHEFVPVARVPCARNRKTAEEFLLLVGAPWYPKGVDVLVAAFRKIRRDFPNLKLKLLGYYEDRPGLDAVIGGTENIELLSARSNPEALDVISTATAIVLPSRCEGMGRVLLEAMASGVPVVASCVGGIPFLLNNGECGILVPVDDPEKLGEALREVLRNDNCRQRLTEAGYRRAHLELNEATYVEQFTKMVAGVAPERS
jgi:glycosyltransferase involved in cell wall biosynthesis